MALLAAGLSLLTAQAQEPAASADRGARILADGCGRCHSLAPTGASPLPAAPPFRDVYDRFAPLDLRAMLRQGMVSRHREMPQMQMSDEESDAVMAFLYALAAGR
ncbi:MAG: cytochrome c [Hyphomicrobiaceae bacterium]|nr:cytochrome c [Hyphomicrobiaceae bacterium]